MNETLSEVFFDVMNDKPKEVLIVYTKEDDDGLYINSSVPRYVAVGMLELTKASIVDQCLIDEE